MLKIGHLVLFRVCKAWPDATALLVWIEPEGPFALLPRGEAQRAYRVGETGYAAVQALSWPYPRVSQRTVHCIRRRAELALAPLRADGRLAVTRVAYQPDWPWAKVLVRLAAPEVLREAVQLLAREGPVDGVKLMLVPKEEWLEQQIRVALYPAPPEAVVSIRPADPGAARTLAVVIRPEMRGRVLGPHGWNLQAAERLVRRRLVLADAGVGVNGQAVGNGRVHGRLDAPMRHSVMVETT